MEFLGLRLYAQTLLSLKRHFVHSQHLFCFCNDEKLSSFLQGHIVLVVLHSYRGPSSADKSPRKSGTVLFAPSKLADGWLWSTKADCAPYVQLKA